MSVSTTRPASLLSRLAPHAWWILLLLALGFFWTATARRIARVEAITILPTWSADAPQRDAASATGFARGQRTLIVPGHHNPSFWWIMEAQQSVEQGTLRLRHIDYDAAPDGREIRRTSLYRWWLIAVGWVHALFSGEPLGGAIERGALLADPILFGLMLAVGAAYGARYIGAFAAIGFVAGAISLFPLAANFQPGAPDPHALAWVLALGSVLPLIASPMAVGLRRRTHFAVAGVFGGLGFWNDATSQAPVVLAVGIGGLVCGWLCRSELARDSSGITCKQAPTGGGMGPVKTSRELSPWRAWALAGALTTFFASLLEFAPNHVSWSLDSVNPIHATAWWGAGELLHGTALWLRRGRETLDGRAVVLWCSGAVAVLAWPIVGVIDGSGALLASDFYALELANHPSGGFAPSLKVWLNRPGSVGAKWATVLPCALFLVLLARVFSRATEREQRGRLVFVFAVALVAGVLACLQLRWWNLFDVFALVVLAILFADSGLKGTGARVRILATVLLVVPGLFVGFPRAVEGGKLSQPREPEIQALIERDFSYWLGKRIGDEPPVLWSTPVFSSAVAFYGGFDVVVSSDDANETGFLTGVRVASATTEQEASVLLKSRAITHVALPMWDAMLDQFVHIGLRVPPGQPLPPSAFSTALREWDVPLWMRPMDYVVSKETGFGEHEVRAFALQAETEPELGLSRLGELFIERGHIKEAQSIKESLKAYPRSVTALSAIAAIELALQDRARTEDTLETLIPYLSRRTARNLPADRRISLATLFIQTNRADQAREQINACFEALDSATLRTLTTATVVRLVALSRSLTVPFPNAELEAAAMELVPPSIRARLMQPR